jgi:hypothetical protein
MCPFCFNTHFEGAATASYDTQTTAIICKWKPYSLLYPHEIMSILTTPKDLAELEILEPQLDSFWSETH